jgi:citrate lyase beta subunit
MQKGLTLRNDCIVVDLEDAVHPSKKDEARANAMDYLLSSEVAGKGTHKSILLRVNCPLTTQWGADDLNALKDATQAQKDGLAGVVVPMVEDRCALDFAQEHTDLPLWAMIETARGLLNVEDTAAHSSLDGIIFGKNDFTKDIQAHASSGADIVHLQYAMQRCVVAARAYGKHVIDGVHMDIGNLETLETTTRTGRNFGFDGRSLVHPSHIDITNAVYSPLPEDVLRAQRVIEAYAEATAQGKGVAVVNGVLIESLHVEQAQLTLARHEQAKATAV